MSDLKPPTQNRPGAAPSRRRTAILRAAIPVPTSKNFGQRSFIWGTWSWAHACGGPVLPPAALEYKDAPAAKKPKRVGGICPPAQQRKTSPPPPPGEAHPPPPPPPPHAGPPP